MIIIIIYIDYIETANYTNQLEPSQPKNIILMLK